MKIIPITKGYSAIVDDDDFDYLNQFKWYAQPSRKIIYAYRMSESKNYSKRRAIPMHREILIVPEGFEVDHINRNGIDNRKENLRVVLRNENFNNKSNNKKYPGVYKCSSGFYASIVIKGKNYYLGIYDNPEMAHNAYLGKINEIKKQPLPASNLTDLANVSSNAGGGFLNTKY